MRLTRRSAFRPHRGQAAHAPDRHRHRGRRACRLGGGRHARPRRLWRRAGRSARELSAGFPRREDRRHAGAHPGAHRTCRRGAARSHPRRRKLGRALRPPRREAAGRPARHSLSHAGQHDPRRDSAERHAHPRQGDGYRDERAAPGGHALDRRRDLRAPRHRGERAQCRPAPQTGNGAPRREQDALDHARLRSCAGGTRELSVSGADLLRRAPGRPHRLHHAVSDWRDDAREPVRLSRDGRSVAARVPRGAARDLDGADAGAWRRSPARSTCPGRCRSARPISM